MQKIKLNWPDVVAGAILLSIGIFFGIAGRGLALGTAANMGPGYFPRALSFLLIGIGLVLVGRSVIVAAERIDWDGLMPVSVVLLSLLLFTLVVEPFGLAPAVFGAILVARFPFMRSHPVETIVLSLVSAVLLSVLFVHLLGLPMKVLPG